MWLQTLQRAAGKLLQQLCSIAAITMSLKSSEKHRVAGFIRSEMI